MLPRKEKEMGRIEDTFYIPPKKEIRQREEERTSDLIRRLHNALKNCRNMKMQRNKAYCCGCLFQSELLFINSSL